MAALQMTWQQRCLPSRRKLGAAPLGLKNLGNSCYLNSVLQCLTYTPPLAQFCLSSQHSSHCKSLFTNRDKECPFCLLERQIARSLTLEAVLDAPSKIQKSLTLFAEHFRWGRQEDAHEFLRYVIDACHNACLKLRKRVSTNGGKAAEPLGPSTVMKEIFGGALLSQVKCLSCKGESNKNDVIMDISLDLFQSNSLKEALERFFQPELLDGNNKYNCSKCKKLSVAKKQMFILRSPNVLVVQLKRFEGIHGGKINRNIEFEEVLVLSKFMCSSSQDPQPEYAEYNLFGSIVHSGYSPESGHYYAYVKDPSGRWYCCNDAHVSLSSTQEVLSEKVYILFYLRSNQVPKPTKSGLPCNGKVSDSNGNEVPTCQMSSEDLRPLTARPNGVLSSKNNVSTASKNGKIVQNPQIKSINFKISDMKEVTANGNGYHKVHNNTSAQKMSDTKQSSIVKQQTTLPTGMKEVTANGNGYHKVHNNTSAQKMSDTKQSSIVKQQTTLPDSGPTGEPKIADKIEISSKSISTAADKDSSDVAEQGRKQILQVPNGNGYSNPLKIKVHEDNAPQNSAAMKREPDCDHSSNNTVKENGSGISALKRKSCDADSLEVLDLCPKEASTLPRNEVSCKIQATCHRTHSSGEFESFKDMITKEASSELQSCGWVDRVHDFMRTRKRLCVEVTGSCPNDTELRKQLVIEAKKTFLSQIPESLKEHLIARLRSFNQDKRLLDT